MMQLNKALAKNVLADMMANRNESDEYTVQAQNEVHVIVIFGE